MESRKLKMLLWSCIGALGLLVSSNTWAQSANTGTPLSVQRCDKWCWAAGIEMVGRQHGLPIDQCQVVSARLDMNCCRPDACLTACNQLSGLPVQINQTLSRIGLHGSQYDFPISEDLLVSSLNRNLPVMVAATNLTTGHFIVVTGYRTLPNGIRLYEINDPWPGVGVVSVTYSRLLSYNGQPWLFTWIARD